MKQHTKFNIQNGGSIIKKIKSYIMKKYELNRMKNSAKLYIEIYKEDNELQELTESALIDWTE